jgi:sugar/nucleoside kinase (ribokinase family)
LTGPLGSTAPLWRESRPAGSAFDVLGIGQNALDRVCELRGGVDVGDKRALPACRDLPGGQVATAVLTCARLGLRCAYAGRVGDDAAATAALAPLRQAGIDLAGVATVAGAPTQTAMILVDPDSGERTILWHRSAALRVEVGDLDRARIESARALLLDAGDPEASAWAAGVARNAGIPVILDADQRTPELAPLLSRVDFPLVSTGFAEFSSGNGCVRETLRMLLDCGARLAAVTLGNRGVVAASGGDVVEVPAFAVDAKDTTGAGDVFHGAFAWALLAGWSAVDVLDAACAAAAMNCRAPGAQGGIPGRSELASFLRSSRSQRSRAIEARR